MMREELNGQLVILTFLLFQSNIDKRINICLTNCYITWVAKT